MVYEWLITMCGFHTSISWSSVAFACLSCGSLHSHAPVLLEQRLFLLLLQEDQVTLMLPGLCHRNESRDCTGRPSYEPRGNSEDEDHEARRYPAVHPSNE